MMTVQTGRHWIAPCRWDSRQYSEVVDIQIPADTESSNPYGNTSSMRNSHMSVDMWGRRSTLWSDRDRRLLRRWLDIVVKDTELALSLDGKCDAELIGHLDALHREFTSLEHNEGSWMDLHPGDTALIERAETALLRTSQSLDCWQRLHVSRF